MFLLDSESGKEIGSCGKMERATTCEESTEEKTCYCGSALCNKPDDGSSSSSPSSVAAAAAALAFWVGLALLVARATVAF